jgi:hypothetical protein
MPASSTPANQTNTNMTMPASSTPANQTNTNMTMPASSTPANQTNTNMTMPASSTPANQPNTNKPTTTLDPLKQFKSGIAAKDIQCKSDFSLVLKESDGSPACVHSATVQILILRGWAAIQ